MRPIDSEGRKKIEESLRQKYVRVALTPEGNFRYPTGIAGLEAQDYDREILEKIPVEVLASHCGVGNPFSLGPVSEGDSVLDIGCGAGVDTIIAAVMTGPKGSVAGIDIVPDMLARAHENLLKAALGNVTFLEASAESLPFPDANFDLVISNGVFNLVPDKFEALKEAFRVLKPSGRLQVADQVLTGEPEDDVESRISNWAR